MFQKSRTLNDMTQQASQKLLLVMRDQKLDPVRLLADQAHHPDERAWGYRPLCRLLGPENVATWYVPKPRNYLLGKILGYIKGKWLGDMVVNFRLAREIWARRKRGYAVFITDNSAIFTFLLTKRWFNIDARIYPLLLGWVEFKFPQMPAWQRFIWLRLLQSADAILSLGLQEVEALCQLGLSNARFLHFGVDVDFWRPGAEEPENFVFSVGADPHRDFATFLAATSDLPVVLCTYPHLIKGFTLGNNVRVVQGTQVDVRRWFRQARLVVIPLQDTMRPSGQNCILQAMATGKTVITTRTKGEWTDLLVDGENCILVPPGDMKALHQAIASLYADLPRLASLGVRAQETVRQYFTSEHFVRAIARTTGFEEQIIK